MEPVNPILARKVGLAPRDTAAQDAADAKTSPARQMRRALGRAADKAVGLSVSVLGIAEEDLDAETMIESGPDGGIVLGLRGATAPGLTGLFLIDPPLRSALVEIQTMGSLLPAAKTERAVTGTDAVMCVPFADQLMKQLAEAEFGLGVFEPASYDMGPIADLRTAGLVMTQGVYRCWRITIEIGGGERQGEILIAMRPKVAAPAPLLETKADWSRNLRRVLEDAPARLEAVLATMVLPISKIEAFEVGQIVHLAGTTVGSVTLTGPDGKAVATARLGQVAGKRAVRIQPVHVELQEDVPTTGQAGPRDGARLQAAPPDEHVKDTA